MSTIFLGIDVGTSSVKVVATAADGELVREASTRYPTTTDRHGGAEQDASAWWEALCALAPDVVGGDTVAAVAVTSQAPTIVPVDASADPVGPALTWLDRRAQADAARIADFVDSRNGADAFFGTAKLPWLVRERPETARRTHRILSANGFIVARLTDVMVLDDSSASLMQGFDESASDFPSALREAHVGLDLLPEIRPVADVVGRVSEAAARATGITAGARVAAGAIDSVGSAIEAGVLRPGGPLVEMTGFSSVSMLAVPAGTSVPGLIHSRHCVPGVDLLIAAQVTAGATIDWVNGLDPATDVRTSPELSSRERPSRVSVVPSLAGERTPTWNPMARGILDGVDLATDDIDLLIAAMEGNAFALATDIALFAQSKHPVTEVLATGGGASSPLWLQIKADVTGVPVHKATRGHGAAQGASYLAGFAAGAYALEDVVTGSERETTYLPDESLGDAYRAKRAWMERLAELNAHRAWPHTGPRA
ncbi:FGGY-family carbohydrate kinase [Microbacterium sp. G2-8]|uniref:xylulokinase n=1 Tax=Microbacterium sp. G2-8 TaxID=2842454 RepID=UPI001C8A00BD|nr:FGGY family carbohydrate kinase [Microbacterium sp. G2-8]